MEAILTGLMYLTLLEWIGVICIIITLYVWTMR
jgi:hypothetical protein